MSAVWDGSVAPGGYVCGVCGVPVESEPCAAHDQGPPNIGDTCCGKCPAGTCYVDQVTGA